MGIENGRRRYVRQRRIEKRLRAVRDRIIIRVVILIAIKKRNKRKNEQKRAHHREAEKRKKSEKFDRGKIKKSRDRDGTTLTTDS